MSYELNLAMIEYKVLVMRDDMDGAAAILPRIPQVLPLMPACQHTTADLCIADEASDIISQMTFALFTKFLTLHMSHASYKTCVEAGCVEERRSS